jgi:hypothetical protein
MANSVAADPKNKVTIRHLFESIKNMDILIHFLNRMLPLKKDCKFKRLSFILSFRLPHADLEKEEPIIKLSCIDETNRETIVLIAFSSYMAYSAQRDLEYSFEARANQMTPWEVETMPKSAITIGRRLKRVFILGISGKFLFPCIKNSISGRRGFTCNEMGEKSKFFRFVTTIFVQLPNFTLSIDHVETTTEKWCYFLNHTNEVNQLDLEKLFAKGKMLKRAYEELNMDDRWPKEEIQRYESEMQSKSQQDAKDEDEDDGKNEGIDEGKNEGIELGRKERRKEGREGGREEGEKRGREEGEKRGREKGREKGEKRGREKGEKRGREKEREKREKRGREKEREKGRFEERALCACKMISSNMDLRLISDRTNLSVDFLIEIKSAMSPKKPLELTDSTQSCPGGLVS